MNDFAQVIYRADNTAAIIRASTPAPEPSAVAGLGIGIFGLGALALKARKRTA